MADVKWNGLYIYIYIYILEYMTPFNCEQTKLVVLDTWNHFKCVQTNDRTLA